MSIKKTVTFCGHRDISPSEIDDVRLWLSAQTESVISQGGSTFFLGGYGDFDKLAATVVRAKKEKYPFITSILVLPYLDHRYNAALYDDTTYPPLESVPKRFAIAKRNEWMVDASDVVIAYVKRDWGGAANTLKLARQRHKQIICYTDKM